MDPLVHRVNPVTWILAAVAMAAAGVLVVVHWSSSPTAVSGGWELVLTAGLGLTGLMAYVLERRRLGPLDR
jgi:hypothetical protein